MIRFRYFGDNYTSTWVEIKNSIAGPITVVVNRFDEFGFKKTTSMVLRSLSQFEQTRDHLIKDGLFKLVAFANRNKRYRMETRDLVLRYKLN